jgi:hypothetical protein
LQRVLGHAGVEHDRALAVHAQLELAQEASAVHIEAELAVGQGGQVAAPIGDQERLVVLEDELGQTGSGLGGEDIVVLADDDVAVWCLGHAARRRTPSRRYTAS